MTNYISIKQGDTFAPLAVYSDGAGTPIDRTGLLHWYPGLDQPFTHNFANNTDGTQFGTSGGIAATNPPIPWTRSGLLM